MAKNILVLNASPRAGGNTAQLVEAFSQGAQDAGHTVTVFPLGQLTIHPCCGCMAGGKDPESPCTQKDDMDKIYPCYRCADVLVLATPLYYWQMTAQLKTAIDRLFAITEASGRLPGKSCLLLATGAGQPPETFGPLTQYYQSLATNMGWANLGTLLAGGVTRPGDIANHEALAQAQKLGQSL